MKSFTLQMCILSLTAISTAMSQDYSTFLTPIGFHLPPMKSGQYVLALAPRLSRASVQSSSSGTQLVGGIPISLSSTSDYPSSSLRITSAAYYGISEKTTVYAGVEYLPKQKLGTSTVTSLNTLSTTDYTQEAYSTSLIFAHRVRSIFEMSVAVSLQGYRQTTAISSTNNRSYDVSLNLVLLGD